ncbi:NDP-hexose 2,3-dehydratase family protein [Micromonospora harpali]|uniref:NDP-hexose 2,3-dehydratase family protein n=1 Tax=Micromonospora harpali TaxID=1490225 RepID=A0ABW1HIW8_9ACTN
MDGVRRGEVNVLSGILSRSDPRPSVLPDGLRVLRSGSATQGVLTTNEEFSAWLREREATDSMTVEQVPLDDMRGWHFSAGRAALVHDSGKFFSVGGVDVSRTGRGPRSWQQPIIRQNEVGILGLLAKEFGGVLHFLMQAKIEPGNRRQVQLSPTVQATRSNYTKVHGGASTPYLEHFLRPGRGRVLADVLQSEQGTWFLGKRNRNMVVETTDDVPVRDNFRWLTFGQIRQLLTVPNMINMDSRTVLSCLPSDTSGWLFDPLAGNGDCADPEFAFDLQRSLQASEAEGRHTDAEIISWLNDVRIDTAIELRPVGLAQLEDWELSRSRIEHRQGKHFRVIGVSVASGQREVTQWAQPLIAPCDVGLVAFLTRRINGVLHILMRASVEAGFLDVAELGPTLQCNPATYADLPPQERPRFYDYVLAARDNIRYDVLLSEEGGRFYHAECRYLVLECDAEPAVLEPHPDFRWMTVRQLMALLRHHNYVNVQARTLLACLHALW